MYDLKFFINKQNQFFHIFYVFLNLFQGCAYRNHTVNATERSSDIFQDMLTYFDLICVSQPTQPILNENIGLDRITPCHSERALVQWLRALEPDSAELKKVIVIVLT